MPLYRKWTYEGGYFGIWKVNEEPGALRAMLSADFRYDEELASMKALSRKVEYVAVRVLLAALTGSEKRILHYPSGKPYLEDGSFRITVSHTRGFVAVGLHPEREVGIDIEYMSERVGKIASRILGPEEEAETTVDLLLHWCAKETMYKMLGAQEVDFARHFRIIRTQADTAVKKIRGIEFRTSSRMQFDLSYWVAPDFVCTWSVGLQPSCE